MLKKIAPLAALGVVLLGGAGVAAASVAAKEPAKAYGVCVSTTGAVRVLEAKNLPKSRHGKCKSGERRVLLPGVDGVPKPFTMPAKMQFTFDGVTAVCTRGKDTAAGVPAYACARPTASPSPTPTS
ncbi:hypothetical protein [Nonomuraea indica]|uniref:hypothetical protein n=1 Tax=Nonomuraea indica TaxID=1581193 RepID=UPI000C7D9477|nr:hypothetical protein [Nonomuraea indica]